MIIGCSGYVREGTGIGVVQHHLYPRLERLGHELVLSPGRDLGRKPHHIALGLLRGFLPPIRRSRAFLSIVPPLPFLLGAPAVTVVHDLRWLRTKGGLGRKYRAWDLRRSVRRSRALLCISQHTSDDLLRFVPSAAGKTSVALLGPGMVGKNAVADASVPGNVILIGGAPHKRNELAASALAASRPSWCDSITGVGLSEDAKSTLVAAFGEGRCTWLKRPSDAELIAAYEAAETFVFLGVDEGFGLPYIEALTTGCRVVAVDQPLTREILGNAAALLDDGDAETIGRQLTGLSFASDEVRATTAAQYDWDIFASKVSKVLADVASD